MLLISIYIPPYITVFSFSHNLYIIYIVFIQVYFNNTELSACTYILIEVVVEIQILKNIKRSDEKLPSDSCKS